MKVKTPCSLQKIVNHTPTPPHTPQLIGQMFSFLLYYFHDMGDLFTEILACWASLVPISLIGIVSMDSPYASVTPSSTHLGNFASNLSGGQMYASGTPLGGAPAAANFNRQHFSPLSLLPPCSSASNGEFQSVGN